MTWQLLLMDANAIVCLLIMVRLMFFRKEGKRHRLSVAVLAYLVILAAGFNAFNILLGNYLQVNLGDLLLNSVICMAVCSLTTLPAVELPHRKLLLPRFLGLSRGLNMLCNMPIGCLPPYQMSKPRLS